MTGVSIKALAGTHSYVEVGVVNICSHKRHCQRLQLVIMRSITLVFSAVAHEQLRISLTRYMFVACLLENLELERYQGLTRLSSQLDLLLKSKTLTVKGTHTLPRSALA